MRKDKTMKTAEKPWHHGKLRVTANGRFLEHEDGNPFFWLGDTAWLLFVRLTREEIPVYFENRARKGFNVTQVMVLHEMGKANAYGRSAPVSFEGFDPGMGIAYGAEDDPLEYFRHVEFAIDAAEEAGMYMALVPAWGSIVKSGALDVDGARRYGRWLGRTFGGRPNIVWLIGGDIRGNLNREVWQALAEAIHSEDPIHLITFHPFGRTRSSNWFHSEPWLSFNMFQSGHRDYDQNTPEYGIVPDEEWRGEDNWRYVIDDYTLEPAKPTIDGEPSYEDIPHGLHDPSRPYWTGDDCRRYAYWSVFAGAFGHTYGHNAVMQMHTPSYDGSGAFGVRKYWFEAVNDPGAGQMTHLKNLMTGVDFTERRFAPDLIDGEPGERYNRLIATAGRDYAFVYSYTERAMRIVLGKIEGEQVAVNWFLPKTGATIPIGIVANTGIKTFTPPKEQPGPDRVLIIKTMPRR